MLSLSTMKETAMRTVGKTGLILKKTSPEILIGLGIIGVVGSTVLACKATLTVKETLHQDDDDIQDIHDSFDGKATKQDGSEYSELDMKRDLTIVYTKRAVRVVKLYAPSLILGAVSIGCLIGSHRIMSKRNVALMAAYQAMEKGFSRYRGYVIEEFGEEKDQGYMMRSVSEADAEVRLVRDGGQPEPIKQPGMSVYGRFFDESCREYQRNSQLNRFFLQRQQAWANDKLRIKGYLFLNDVYDALGMEQSSAGQIVGWLYDDENRGDGYVEFKILDASNSQFLNNRDASCFIDFNVQGRIFDKLDHI